MFKLTTISQILKGGETMKTLGFVLATMFALSVGCFAAVGTVTATIDMYADNAILALPNVPVNPDPMSVFDGSGIDPTYNITRFDAVGQGYTSYDGDPQGPYGNMLLGDGFWCAGAAGQTISYEAIPDGVPDASGNKTDMWISLPGAGNGNGGSAIIGNPFAHTVAIDKGTYTGDHIFFTDGTKLLTWGDAVNNVDAQGNPDPWVSPTMTYFTGFGYDDIWYDNSIGDVYQLDPGKGYWIATYKDNLAMIIPAD